RKAPRPVCGRPCRESTASVCGAPRRAPLPDPSTGNLSRPPRIRTGEHGQDGSRTPTLVGSGAVAPAHPKRSDSVAVIPDPAAVSRGRARRPSRSTAAPVWLAADRGGTIMTLSRRLAGLLDRTRMLLALERAAMPAVAVAKVPATVPTRRGGCRYAAMEPT